MAALPTRRPYFHATLIVLAALIVASMTSCATAKTETSQPVSVNPFIMRATDGEVVDLTKRIEKSRATVLFWWGNSCPCVRRYQSRIEELRDDYKLDGVEFYAIASNAGESAEDISRTAAERDFQLPILIDSGARLADELGVSSTPTTVILDDKGSVRFIGWIDNERAAGKPDRIAYAEKALKSILFSPIRARTVAPTYGCPVTKDLFSSSEPPPTCATSETP